MVNLAHSSPPQTYSVHRHVITRTSTVLRAHFQNRKNKSIDLNGRHSIHRIDFGIYVEWMYTGVLATKTEAQDHGNEVGVEDDDDEEADDEYSYFADAFSLGVDLEDSAYCNTIIAALFEKAEDAKALSRPYLPDVVSINKVYQNSHTVRLRSVLVEIFARQQDPFSLEQIMDDHELHREFTSDLVHRLMEDRKEAPELRVCKFQIGGACQNCSPEAHARKRRREV